MRSFLDGLEARLSEAARRAGIKLFAGFVAAFLVAIGIGFVVLGLWHLASTPWGPIAGALALGVVFFALGFVTLWLGTRRKPKPDHPAPRRTQDPSTGALIEAFMPGMKAGQYKGKGGKGV